MTAFINSLIEYILIMFPLPQLFPDPPYHLVSKLKLSFIYFIFEIII